MPASVDRLNSLEPGFKEKVIELLKRAEDKTGRRWVVTCGRRTMHEQSVLYAQGRTKPGKVVTKAPAGYSAHNYGLAADLAPLEEATSQIDWDCPRKFWELMATEAIALGLTAGYYFKSLFDGPHVEDPEWRSRKRLWLAGKLDID